MNYNQKKPYQPFLERFKERENLENIDGDCLRIEMPDDYYYKKDDYKQAGIVFCPHVKSTGISVGVNYSNLKTLVRLVLLQVHQMV